MSLLHKKKSPTYIKVFAWLAETLGKVWKNLERYRRTHEIIFFAKSIPKTLEGSKMLGVLYLILLIILSAISLML